MMLPSDYPKIFGHYFSTRNSLPILSIGEMHYSRYDLGAIGCPHTMAARELDRAIKQLGVSSIDDLVGSYGPRDFLSLKGFGVTAFYVLTCVLRHANVDLKLFYGEKVTVETVKAQQAVERKRREREVRQQRRRRA